MNRQNFANASDRVVPVMRAGELLFDDHAADCFDSRFARSATRVRSKGHEHLVPVRKSISRFFVSTSSQAIVMSRPRHEIVVQRWSA